MGSAVFFGLIVLGMAACFLVWFFVYAWSVGADRRAERDRASLEAEVVAARMTLDDLEQRAHALPPPPPVRIDPARRSQALRLARRGQTAEEIAAELGIPLQEVVILLKVHRLIVKNV
ncbi:MAG TPA: hypothetical protein VGF59_12605 [Bryobacteraceae bacterium]|jgi:hypothetical protein